MSVKVTCPFMASLLHFAGYWLFRVTAEDERGTTYHFEMPGWSYEELRIACESPEGQSVSNIKMYTESFKRVQHIQGLARRSRDLVWVERTAERRSGTEEDMMYEHLKISMNGPCDLDNMSREEIRASLDELVSRMGKTEPLKTP